MEKITF